MKKRKMNKRGKIGWLEVGDKVIICNPLGNRETIISSIDGNRCFSNFRTFHRDVYVGSRVFEFGKPSASIVNDYFVELG